MTSPTTPPTGRNSRLGRPGALMKQLSGTDSYFR